MSDWLYRMPAVHLAEAADRGGARVWLYELCWGFGPHGASHGLDTLLLFGTTDVYGEVSSAGPSAVAATEQLSHLIRAEHLAFATSGDPGWTGFGMLQPWTRVYRPEAALVARIPRNALRPFLASGAASMSWASRRSCAGPNGIRTRLHLREAGA